LTTVVVVSVLCLLVLAFQLFVNGILFCMCLSRSSCDSARADELPPKSPLCSSAQQYHIFLFHRGLPLPHRNDRYHLKHLYYAISSHLISSHRNRGAKAVSGSSSVARYPTSPTRCRPNQRALAVRRRLSLPQVSRAPYSPTIILSTLVYR